MNGLRNTLLATGLAVLGTTAAQAADLYQPPILEPLPVEEEFGGGWYLRGYLGMSNQQVDELDNVLIDSTPSYEEVHSSFDSAPFGGGAIGYKANDWLRGDISAEYRGRANYHGLGRYNEVFGSGTDEYSAAKSEIVVLANAFIDMGSWNGISPYIGAGIGGSYNTIHAFQDVNTPNLGVAFGDDDSQWELAYAFYAGVGFQVTQNLTMDLGYRYINLGDAQSGDLETYTGVNTVDNPMVFKDLTSHDVMLGFRYAM